MGGRDVSKMVLNGGCLRRFEMNQPVDNAPKYEDYLRVDDHNTMKAVGHLS